jgi:hypothetical protein
MRDTIAQAVHLRNFNILIDTAPDTVYCSVCTNVFHDIEEQVSALHYFGARRNMQEGFDMYLVSHSLVEKGVLVGW